MYTHYVIMQHAEICAIDLSYLQAEQNLLEDVKSTIEFLGHGLLRSFEIIAAGT